MPKEKIQGIGENYVYVHEPMHPCVSILTCESMHVEARGQFQLPSLVTLHLSFFRQSFSLNLELANSTRMDGQEPPEIPLSSPPQYWGYQYPLPYLAFCVDSGRLN